MQKRAYALLLRSEGAGSKPLSVHLSAGRIQLCILPGPVNALRTCLDLLQRGCSFQPRSGNLTLTGSSYAWRGSFLLQSRPSRTSGLNRTARILERGLSSVSYTVSDPPAPSPIPHGFDG
uniref:Uncharacterized protein n=1 Tax=uncultured marine group II/III euryarchaeote KM3_200_B09 TaxID=1457975 RepID=A0A075GTD7_9EURY|nr:hypothetical protein [uncultured marine group II/III euryarchaeote KM3_200_B09]